MYARSSTNNVVNSLLASIKKDGVWYSQNCTNCAGTISPTKSYSYPVTVSSYHSYGASGGHSDVVLKNVYYA